MLCSLFVVFILFSNFTLSLKGLIMIVKVKVVLNRTVVVDSD